MNERSGRKRRLTVEEGRQLAEEYLCGHALVQEAQQFSLMALAAKYGIAPATIYDYVEMRHKGEPGYEKPREGIREVVGRIAPPVAVQALRALRLDGDGALFASAP